MWNTRKSGFKEVSRLQKAVQGTMPTAFLTHPQPLGSTLGTAPCVPCQALLARAVCRPCLERTWRHTEPAYTAAMGAGRLQSTGSSGHPAENPTRDWELLQSKISTTLIKQMRFSGEELIALHTPCSNSSLLQLPGGGDSKGTWNWRPQGKALLHQSPAGHKHVGFPCEEAKVQPELKSDFLSNAPLMESFLTEMLRKIFLRQTDK